jgi:hypothetical protein
MGKEGEGGGDDERGGKRRKGRGGEGKEGGGEGRGEGEETMKRVGEGGGWKHPPNICLAVWEYKYSGKGRMREEGEEEGNENTFLVIHHYSIIDVAGSLSFYSLDNKLDGTMRTPPSSSHYTPKLRSPHASFKLPVSPAEPGVITYPAKIPVPKLVARPRPHGKQLSLDFEPATIEFGTGSPVLNPPPLRLSKNNNPSTVENDHLLSTTDEGKAQDSGNKRQLVHTRSLDGLLANQTPVVVELTQDKASKYSKLVITASTYDLCEEAEPAGAKESGETLRVVTGTIGCMVTLNGLYGHLHSFHPP